jgi:hypothetical protein
MPQATDVAANIASLIISGEISMLQAPSPASLPPQQWHSEAIKGYIVAYYYAALTNVSCQACLLSTEQVEDNDIVKGIIDASYQHFYMLDNWFARLDPNELQTNPDSHLFDEVRDVWKPWVKDWRIISKRNGRIG